MPTPAVRVEGLVYHYEGIPALDGVSLTIQEGAYLAIVGQNGSGKTTLVKHFNGLLKPSAGRVLTYGVDTRHASVGQLARDVGYVFQNPDHQIFCATTRQEISFGPSNLGLKGDGLRQRVEDALQAFGLQDYAEAPPAMLGFGLRRKVAVAAVYAMRPRLLVLDEPTSGLDWRSACDLMALVDRLHHHGHTIVLVTHDMRLVAEHCAEVAVIDEGRLLVQGETREVFGRTSVLDRAQITPPPVTRLAMRLSAQGMPADILTIAEFVQAFETIWLGQRR